MTEPAEAYFQAGMIARGPGVIPIAEQLQPYLESMGAGFTLNTTFVSTDEHYLEYTEMYLASGCDAIVIEDLDPKGEYAQVIYELCDAMGVPVILVGEDPGDDVLAEHPHVCYNLWNGNSDDVINRLKKGLCELAIIMEPHNAEGVYAIPVYSEPWIAMLPQACPLAQEPGDTIDFQKVADYETSLVPLQQRQSEIFRQLRSAVPRV